MPAQVHDALRDHAHLLACPVCGTALAASVAALVCPSGHSYDVSKHGTVTLTNGRANLTTADSAAMLQDRAAYYDAGHWDPVIAQVSTMVAASLPEERPVVIDAGGGTGHLLAATLERIVSDGADPRGPCGIALDSSSPAVRMCRRRDPRILGIVADLWRPWPARAGVADAVLTMFAPRNPAEAQRVLTGGGSWWVITPTDQHLSELRGSVDLLDVPGGKGDRVMASLPDGLSVRDQLRVTASATLTRDDVAHLVRMGPHRHHIDDEALRAQVGALPELTAATHEVDVTRIARTRT